jgi:hypothetical protein
VLDAVHRHRLGGLCRDHGVATDDPVLLAADDHLAGEYEHRVIGLVVERQAVDAAAPDLQDLDLARRHRLVEHQQLLVGVLAGARLGRDDRRQRQALDLDRRQHRGALGQRIILGLGRIGEHERSGGNGQRDHE